MSGLDNTNTVSSTNANRRNIGPPKTDLENRCNNITTSAEILIACCFIIAHNRFLIQIHDTINIVQNSFFHAYRNYRLVSSGIIIINIHIYSFATKSACRFAANPRPFAAIYWKQCRWRHSSSPSSTIYISAALNNRSSQHWRIVPAAQTKNTMRQHPPDSFTDVIAVKAIKHAAAGTKTSSLFPANQMPLVKY